jgi:4-diphosphocytidyl-2-C-methyl-D-erythritol kinase
MNSQELRFKSWAKINLCLHLGRKRSDGYHELKSLMQLIDLNDELSFFPRDEGLTLEVKSTVSPLPSVEENIIYRAARKLMDRHHCKAGAHIVLDKKIPVGGGLGGGSSNAFVTMKALNLLWNLNMPAGEMHLLCSQTGSDVPFFALGGTALAEGRGETLTRLSDIPHLFLILVIPPFSISTHEAYRWWDEDAHAPESISIASALEHLALGQIEKLLHNDFEETLFRRFPLLEEIKRALLSEGCCGALMTGSGSTIFGIAEDRQKADAIALEMEGKKYGTVRVTETREREKDSRGIEGFSRIGIISQKG